MRKLQLARLIAARERDAASRNLFSTTRIVLWEGYKGIDDAAKTASVAFTTVSILQWVADLKGDPPTQSKGSGTRSTTNHRQATSSVAIQPLSVLATLDLQTPNLIKP